MKISFSFWWYKIFSRRPSFLFQVTCSFCRMCKWLISCYFGLFEKISQLQFHLRCHNYFRNFLKQFLVKGGYVLIRLKYLDLILIIFYKVYLIFFGRSINITIKNNLNYIKLRLKMV